LVVCHFCVVAFVLVPRLPVTAALIYSRAFGGNYRLRREIAIGNILPPAGTSGGRKETLSAATLDAKVARVIKSDVARCATVSNRLLAPRD
jgi:hypothetical protein